MEDFEVKDSPFPPSPVVPQLLQPETVIQFHCHKDIACFNACCKNIDISLTPYDILRLKKRLNMSSGEFLKAYTFPYEMEKDGIAGVKLKPVEGGTACRFMTEQGCSVYEDRPTACRYYPVGLLSIRRQGENFDREAYAIIKENHCLGHNEARQLTIAEYRKEQGLEEYDELSRGWRQLILKKKSAGPTVGKPSKRSLQMFFMTCYDLDQFRDFATSAQFNDLYEVEPETREKIKTDDIALMQFGFRLLRQVMFNEMSIPIRPDALEKRLARKREREQILDRIVEKIGPVETVPVEELEDKYKHASD
ncbi:YkgJ family cysteine cluster protein [Thiobacter aerophilum]|uniref:YkgJ family cysteine cluster protein n=1 Tax=Thiobacter aerophilum TaxID=3121275 RepID=A0ABV0EG18_9BURK